MREMTLQFLTPYYSVAVSAAYSTLQNFQAIGIDSIWHGPYIELQSSLELYTGFYLILVIPPVLILSVGAGWLLSRKLAIAVTIAWLLPGVSSLLGYQLMPVAIPGEYRIGDGYLGLHIGTIYNVAFAFVTGWSVITVLMHLMNARAQFTNVYDHIWYPIGLVAAVFFVLSNNISTTTERLQETEQKLHQSLSILKDQFLEAERYCRIGDVESVKHRPKEEFCRWVTAAYDNTRRLLDESAVGRKYMNPDLGYFMKLGRRRSDTDSWNNLIEVETKHYNQAVCADPRSTVICTEVPMHLNADPRLFDKAHPVSLLQKHALALQALAPTIEYNWKQSVRENEKFREHAKSPHQQWLFFLLVSFLAGGKVAGSTRGIFVSESARPQQAGRESGKWRGLSRIVINCAKAITHAVRGAFESVLIAIRSLSSKDG